MEIKKKRGRPPINGQPMTAAQRKQRQFVKLEESGLVMVQIILTKPSLEVIDRFRALTALSRNEVVESALATWISDTIEALPALEAWAAKRTAEQLNSTQET